MHLNQRNVVWWSGVTNVQLAKQLIPFSESSKSLGELLVMILKSHFVVKKR